MKTWEMIKELTKNPKKKFIRKGDPLEISVDGLKYLRWKSGHDYINLDHDWEEVKEPVDFMTIIRVCKSESLMISMNYKERGIGFMNYKLDDLLYRLAADYNNYELAEILENGKWYIED